MIDPRLIASHVPRDPRGVVLVLHGGGSRRDSVRVSPAQLSVLRMVPVARRVVREARSGLAVHRLLNSRRGWDTEHTPVDDVHWALARLAERYGDLPVGLVGHSLGGRAALLAAADGARVASVVALNPYLLPQDRPGPGATPTLLLHGDQDRIASHAGAVDLVRRAPAAARVGLVTIEGGKHAMLRRARTFESLAAQFTAATLLDGHRVRSVALREVLAGQRQTSI